VAGKYAPGETISFWIISKYTCDQSSWKPGFRFYWVFSIYTAGIKKIIRHSPLAAKGGFGCNGGNYPFRRARKLFACRSDSQSIRIHGPPDRTPRVRQFIFTRPGKCFTDRSRRGKINPCWDGSKNMDAGYNLLNQLRKLDWV